MSTGGIEPTTMITLALYTTAGLKGLGPQPHHSVMFFYTCNAITIAAVIRSYHLWNVKYVWHLNADTTCSYMNA